MSLFDAILAGKLTGGGSGGGAAESNVFVVKMTLNYTTLTAETQYSELVEAYNAGKFIVLRIENASGLSLPVFMPLGSFNTSYSTFCAMSCGLSSGAISSVKAYMVQFKNDNSVKRFDKKELTMS